MDFRKITAIIQKAALEKVEARLRELGVPGVSVTQVKGYGHYANFFSKDWLVSHVRVEVFIGQARAEEITLAIMNAAHTGMDGDGIVAVLPVESVYHIRTLQKCGKEVCD